MLLVYHERRIKPIDWSEIMLSIDELIKKTGNRYYLTTIVAKRSKQLNQGAKPLVETQPTTKPLLIALKEVAEDKIKWSKETT